MATLNAPLNISPVEDAEALRKAFAGWGTHEKEVVSILGHRTAYQRNQIRKAYEELYQEDLIKRLESELSGDFEKAVYRWMLEPADRDAVLAHVALKNGSKDYHVIVEIACVLSPEELFYVRRAYHNRYKHSLEEDVAAKTSGDIRKLLVGLVTAFRYGGDEIDARLAKSEADILHGAAKDKKFNSDEVIRVLTTRSKTQLTATFNKYRDEHGISISKKLLDESSNDFLKVFHTTVRCLNDPKKYYEKVLRNGIRRFGTDEDALTRVVVSRAEKDMREIKDLYYKRNSIPFDEAVAKEISGDYKNFLLVLLGKQD